MENIINLLIKKAMIEKDEITKNILRLAKSEIEREKEKAKDAASIMNLNEKDNIIKKMIKNNQLTLKLFLEQCANEQQKSDKLQKVDDLVKEINILKSLLPKTASMEDLKLFISNNEIDVFNCKSEGQAIGMIMKQAKILKFDVEAGIVKDYIKEIKLF